MISYDVNSQSVATRRMDHEPKFTAEPVSTVDFNLDDDTAERGVQQHPSSMPVPGEGAVMRDRLSFENTVARSDSNLRQRPLRSMTAPNLGATPALSRPVMGKPQSTKPLFTKELLQPKVPVGKPPGWRQMIRNVLTYNWLNVLLIFIPVSWAMHFSHQGPTLTFVFSFLAIIPLASLLGLGTEEAANRVGDTLGGLLNVTMGNSVELIVAILALVKGELRVVQSAMLGSVLSNSLLVLGMCQFAGGLRFHEQAYAGRQAQTNINALGLAINAIVIPVGFHVFLDQVTGNNAQSLITDANVLQISHGVAIILLFVYVGYMMFQFWTHTYLYAPQDPTAPPQEPTFQDGPLPPSDTRVFRMPSWGSSSDGTSSISSVSTEEDEHQPKLSLIGAIVLLVVVTVVTGFTAEWLVSSIDGLTDTGKINKEFVALILLPLVGNAAEHLTAVVVASKGKLDLAMGIAISSSLQILLLVIPLLLLLGWAIGQPLSLYLDPFETLVLFLGVVSVNWAISDSKTNWFEGMTLMGIYLIIALVFWYYPGIDMIGG